VVVLGVVALVATTLSLSPAAATPVTAPFGLMPSGVEVTSSPALKWNPLPGATSYRVQASLTADFSSSLFNVTTVNTTYVPVIELPVAAIFWRVAGIDGTGTGPYGFSSFTRRLLGPVLDLPVDYNPNVPDPVPSFVFPQDPLSFSWAPVSSAKSYILEIDDADDFVGATKVVTGNPNHTLRSTQEYGQEFFWRVRGASTASGGGILTEWSEVRSYLAVWPDTAELTFPLDTTTESLTDVWFEWDPVLGAASYEIEVSIDIDFNSVSVIKENALVTESYHPAEVLLNGSYFWRVRATDVDGHIGGWSDVHAFTRGWPSDPLAGVSTGPQSGGGANGDDFGGSLDSGIPTPLLPADGGTASIDLEFSWTPVQRASLYEVWVDDASDFVNAYKCTTIQTTLVAGRRIDVSQPACDVFKTSYGQVRYWKVRALDGPTDGIGLWSPTWTFVRGVATDAPVIEPGPVDATIPFVDWQPVEGATAYRVSVFVGGSLTALVSATTVATSYTPTGNGLVETDPTVLPTTTDLRFTVAAIDEAGQTGPASSYSYTMQPPVLTASPEPVPPAVPAPSVDMPNLHWQPVTDASSYTVTITPQGSGVAVLTKAGLRNNAWTATTVVEWLSAGTYAWSVTAVRSLANGGSVTGGSGSFEVVDFSAVAYTAPTNCVAPLDGCTRLTSSPRFDWVAQPGGIYKITIAYDVGFTNIARVYSTQFSELLPREELPDNNVGQAYYWHVQACPTIFECPPIEGTSPDYNSFLKRSNPVLLLGPANGATVQDEPFFSWSPYLTTNLAGFPAIPPGVPAVASDDLEAARYRIQVSTVPSFSTILDDEVTDNTRYSPSAITYPEGPLYWRVRAIDDSGNTLTMSETRTLVKESPAIVIVAPVASPPALPTVDVHVSGAPIFRWLPQAGAAEYELEVYNDRTLLFSNANRVFVTTTPQVEHTPLDSLAAGDYSWRIRPIDGGGRDGRWTTGSIFVIDEIGPTLLSPDDGALVLDDQLVFTWSRDVDAASYRFQRSTAPEFLGITESVTTVARAWAPTVKYPDGTWYWRVLALNANDEIIGTSEVRQFERDTQVAPGSPTGVSGVPGDGEVTVSWIAPVNDGGSPITAYTVTASPGGFGCATNGATSCVVVGLTNGTPYTFTVTAANIRGTSPPSAPSGQVTPADVPTAPTGLAGVPGNAKVSLTWTAPASDGGAPVDGYVVTADPGGASCFASDTPCDVIGLTNGTPYTFTVVATNAAGTSPASAAAGPYTPRTVPSVPTAVVGVPGNAQVAVSWTASASTGGSPINSYTVTAAPGGATCSAAVTACAVTGLANGTPYTFRVSATNAAGASAPSAASAAVTPRTVPGAPTAILGTPGNGQVALSWTAPASNGGAAISGYIATASPGGATCAAATNACTITALTNGVSYTVTVVATNVVGPSPASAAAGPFIPVTTPLAPTGVSGVPGNTKVTVSWLAPASSGGSPVTSYLVTAAPGGATCTTAALSCAVTGLVNGTGYTFTVTATTAVGTSPASAPSAMVVPATVPQKPTAVVAVPGNQQASVSWTAPATSGGSAITSYLVTAAPGGATCTTGSLTCEVVGLVNGTSYTFTVTATNAAGTSLPSNPSAAIMPPGASQCGAGKDGPFVDVFGEHPFCLDIEWLVAVEVTQGYPDGTFRPTASVTRQSMAAFLYRYAGSPPYTPPATPSFPDVPTTHPFITEIEWLAEQGITGGFADGTFRPSAAVTRQSMAAFLYRFAQSPPFGDPAVPSFSDVPTSHPFFTEIEWLAGTEITGGFADGTFRPTSPVTRQAMAAFLHRYDALAL